MDGTDDAPELAIEPQPEPAEAAALAQAVRAVLAAEAALAGRGDVLSRWRAAGVAEALEGTVRRP